MRLGLLARTGKKKDEMLRTTGTSRMCVYYAYMCVGGWV